MKIKHFIWLIVSICTVSLGGLWAKGLLFKGKSSLNVEKTFQDVSYSFHCKPDKEGKNIHYGDLCISLKNGTETVLDWKASYGEKMQRVNYFNFEMQKDVFLTQGNDTLRCVLFHLEQPLNLNQCNKFLMAFQGKINPDEDLYFSYQDKYLGTGPVHLKIDADALD